MKLPVAVRRRLIRSFVALARQHGFVERPKGSGHSAITAEQSAERRIAEIEAKFAGLCYRGSSLRWSWCKPGVATLDYDGKTYRHRIEPDVMLVGTINGTTFFQKFVSHPFYQRGHRKAA